MPAQQRLPDQVGPSMPSKSESLHVQRIDLNIFDCGYIQSSSRGLNCKIRLRILEQVGFANESEIMLPLFSFFCHFRLFIPTIAFASLSDLLHRMKCKNSSTYLEPTHRDHRLG